MVSCLVLVFELLSFACASGFPTSTPPATCSALQAAVPSGDKCSVSSDCTRLKCSMNVLNLYPVYYNVTIHKCHIPVQVGVDIATTDFQWSRTFEGNQTVPIQVANLPLAVSFIGSPYAHVEVNRVAGGIMMSAALWFKDSSGHWSTEKVPIVDRQKIPLDTSDCQSNVYGSSPPDSYNPTDTSSNGGFPLSQQQLMDLLKKYGGLFSQFGKGSTQTGGGNPFPLPSELPSAWFDNQPPSDMSDITQDMMNDPIVKMCVQQLLRQGSIDYWESDSLDFDSKLMKCYCQNLRDGSTSLASVPVQCRSAGKDKSSDTKWYVIGGCVGGAIIVAVIVAIILFCVYMKKQKLSTGSLTYKELEEEEMEEE